jgi:hypothetical protein
MRDYGGGQGDWAVNAVSATEPINFALTAMIALTAQLL